MENKERKTNGKSSEIKGEGTSGDIMRLEKVIFKYGDGHKALKSVNMGFKKGMTTAVIGGNGAGKSTLLLTLNGINKPSEGNVFYKDKAIGYSRDEIMKLRKNVGIVFQNPDNQLFSASVEEDISFGVLNLGFTGTEAREKVDRAIESTGIEDLKSRSTHSLSFGQKKKAAIAGIIAMEPEIMILDEPTAGLDPEGVEEIMNLLSDLKKKMNLTVILSTHDMDLIPQYCEYVYVMSQGEVRASGETASVFSKPHLLTENGLGMPRIGRLLNDLKSDGFDFKDMGYTVEEARAILNAWRRDNLNS